MSGHYSVGDLKIIETENVEATLPCSRNDILEYMRIESTRQGTFEWNELKPVLFAELGAFEYRVWTVLDSDGESYVFVVKRPEGGHTIGMMGGGGLPPAEFIIKVQEELIDAVAMFN